MGYVVSPTRVGQIERGGLYRVEGRGEGVDLIPAQVFRLESFKRNEASGTLVLTGTLWWRIWMCGRWFSGTQRNHCLALHHIGIGSSSTRSSRHDFHLEKLGS